MIHNLPAEVEDYNPWGRPGAGAPTQKQAEEMSRAESRQPDDWVTKGSKRTEAAANKSNTDALKTSKERKKVGKLIKILFNFR